MARHVYTVPVLVHVVADSADDAISKFDPITDAGGGVIVVNRQRLEIVYLNAPPEPGGGFTGTQHGYDLEDLR